MKLFVASGIFHPEAGGPATYLYQLLPQLQARGWTVEALTYGSGETSGYPYPLTRIPRRTLPLRLLDYARAAAKALDRADLVYVHTLGLPLGRRRRAPRIVKIVGDQAWERAIRRGWIAPETDIDAFQTSRYSAAAQAGKAARAREVRTFDGVIVPSRYLREMVMGWGVDAAKVHVIYNALPPEAGAAVGLQPAPTGGQGTVTGAAAGAVRAAFGLPDDVPLILSAARLTRWKGIDHLIAALARMHERTARVVVVGEGTADETRRLKALAQAAGVSERVHWLGQVGRAKIDGLMRAVAYVALYSGYEGLSHTLLESLRAGTPVIASDKGGNPEVVQHEVNGLLVPYIDVNALAAALDHALAPGVRDRLAANARLDAARFGFEAMVGQTDATLRAYVT